MQLVYFRGTVNIAVRDVNEYMPEWRVEEYSAHIQEGDMSDNILTLAAVDRDCSPTFGNICSYRFSLGLLSFLNRCHQMNLGLTFILQLRFKRNKVNHRKVEFYSYVELS